MYEIHLLIGSAVGIFLTFMGIRIYQENKRIIRAPEYIERQKREELRREEQQEEKLKKQEEKREEMLNRWEEEDNREINNLREMLGSFKIWRCCYCQTENEWRDEKCVHCSAPRKTS